MKLINYLGKVALVLLLFVACSKDPKEKVPTITDVAKVYSEATLNLTLDGKKPTGNPQVELEQEEGSLTIVLKNIVEGDDEFEIKNATFSPETKAYISRISGERSDFILGKKVTVNGEIDNGILLMNITTQDIEGTPIDASFLVGQIYKGDMKINVSGTDMPEIEQFVYLEKAKTMATPGIKLRIKKFVFNGLELGDISLDTIAVKEGQEGLYLLKARDNKITLKEIGPVSVDVNGHIYKDEINLSLNIKVSEELTVNVKFDGEIRTAQLSIFIDSDVIVDQPKLMTDKKFVFTVNNDVTAEQLVFTPKITIPKGATLKYVRAYTTSSKYDEIEANTAVDFSKYIEIRYSVTPEGSTSALIQTLSMELIEKEVPTKFSFEEWNEVVVNASKPAATYYTPKPVNLLATSNQGASMIVNIFSYPGGYPVLKTEDGKSGNAVKLVSLDTRGMFMVPALTAGSLFMGTFELKISTPLLSTKFGVAFNKKPLRFKGYYKYQSGDLFIDGSVNPVVTIPNQKDQFAISAVLYEVDSYAETLTGEDINTSNKIVATAVVPNDSEQSAYTPFDVEFKWVEGKTFDKTKQYKLAFLCSSSKDGDKFKGAAGSTLFVDEFEIITE